MTTAAEDERFDVVIAGARVAGASTALHLARAGLRVLVVDPVPEGRDALSTHALMRGGVLQLHRWGLLDEVRDAGTPAVRRVEFDYGDERVGVDLEERDGIGALYAPRRTLLDPILQRAARDAGARFDFGWRVDGVIRDARGRVRGVDLQGPWRARRRVMADLVVGADGARSRVAAAVQAPVEVRARHSTATVFGYARDTETSERAARYQWGFRPRLGFGHIPTNEGRACVFVAMSPAEFRSRRRAGLGTVLEESLRAAAPGLARRVEMSGGVAGLRAFAGAPGFLRTPFGPGWGLVGDAGFFRDPLTAHGITDALRDAELLARSWIEAGDAGLALYREARDHAARGMLEVTDRIASLRWTMPEVQALHRDLAREMKRGIDVLASWTPATGVGGVREDADAA